MDIDLLQLTADEIKNTTRCGVNAWAYHGIGNFLEVLFGYGELTVVR
jgi:hypothetical protein